MTTAPHAGPAIDTGAGRPVTPTSILAARLDELSRRLDTADGVTPELRAELRAVTELAGGLDPYLTACTTPESPALRRLAERTRAHDWTGPTPGPAPLEQEMLSGHVEGQVLKMLVHATRAWRVLEIGMFTGYSALAMAEALPPDGRVVACEIDPDVAGFARAAFADSPHGHKVVVEVGPARRTLDALVAAGEVFDLVFIDADKAGYLGYLDAVLELGLLTEHALVCVDNTLMQGLPWTSGEQTANAGAIAEFNAAVAADPRVEQVVVPLRDGLTLIRAVEPLIP
jgi:caffeoyl-CoA O-methyltransferase